MTTITNFKTMEVPVQGMDCADCALHVEHALKALPGVQQAQVYLAAEKAVLELDPQLVDLAVIRKAVEGAGYKVPPIPELAKPTPPSLKGREEEGGWGKDENGQIVNGLLNGQTDGNGRADGSGRGKDEARGLGGFTRKVLGLFGLVFGAVLLVVIGGEWLGLFDALTERIPWFVGLAVVVLGGYPIFLNVVRAALRRQVISHTLMTVGVIAALLVGEWTTAAVVVFFMRVGDYAERFTTERARRAVKDLTALAPQTARILRDGVEVEVPVSQVQVGEEIVVRPGEKVPVDGVVVFGQATLDQAAITGESMPVEAGPGSKVFAATLAQLGSLRVRVTGVGADTTFGRVIRLVEEAEAHRASVQSIADRFSGYYLPVVAGIAVLTLLLRRDPLATAAVLVVACSCSFALATPIAMLASIGAGAKHGLLIKGGKYLELLTQADVLLVDKTGTLTLGRPVIEQVIPKNGFSGDEVLALAAAVEHYSEHPLAEAVRQRARQAGLTQAVAALGEPQSFTALPGLGVRAWLGNRQYEVGGRRLVGEAAVLTEAERLESAGKTLLFVREVDGEGGQVIGLLSAADTLRPDVPAALLAVRSLGIRTVELLTGDNERTAADLAQRLGVQYRANLLPEDKIAVVKAYQSQGRKVIMVGDGVNDAPALAQADVGIAMGAAGTDIAIEAAHVALMREDWTLVPELLRIARRTMNVVKGNIAFTAVYNVLGLSLAAFGFLPPVLAAAAQSLPDLGILANSARLLRQKFTAAR